MLGSLRDERFGYGRGAGTPLGCSAGEDKDGLLCYPTCQAEFHGVGPMCMPND